MQAPRNQQFRLRRRPQGRVSARDFDLVSTDMPLPGPGQALVQVLYLSIDPTQRLWISDREQYMPPVDIGAVMRGGAIGRVIASNQARWQVGDLLRGQFGWQEYCLADSASPLLVPLPSDPAVPLPALLGVCGLTGLTAHIGLMHLAQPKAGETVLVSAAAGAVGSVVGQIARIAGCRAVGIAGGVEKCRKLTEEFGFAAAIDYKAPGWQLALAAATPDGVAIGFDNVGGPILQAMLERMALGGRVILCGLIAGYNDPAGAAIDPAPILMRRLALRGFIVTDHAALFPAAMHELMAWVRQGRLTHRETILDGLDQAPAALNLLFDGGNIGKLMVRVAD